MSKVFIGILVFMLSGMSMLVFGQGTAAKPVVVAGDVTSIAEGKLVVSTKTGPSEVALNDKTAYKKIPADALTTTAAVAGALTDIGPGDKVTVSALSSADGKTLTARTVFFVSKADIAAKNAKESAEWQRRGVTGKVKTVNAQTNQMTIETRTLMGSTDVVITPKDGAKFLRYAPDSIRFDEAQPSSMADTKAGDIVRALGDKSTDGLSFSAEQIVAGAFETVAGTVVSIDPVKNEVVIKNLANEKNVTVAISESSVLKRFPTEQAEMFARMQMMGAGGARPMGGGPGGARPAGGNPQNPTPGGAAPGQPGQGQPGQGRPGMGGGPGGPRGGGVEEMLERSPTITVADLKAGDIIALSSSKSGDMSRLKAIKLFAGVEPFLRAAQASGGGRRGGGGGPDFNIPGLDGIGFP